MKKVSVRVFHQIDPGGAVTGGIDTVIKGIAKWAADDIDISMVGLSMDPVARPVGQWSVVEVGDKRVHFFAVGVHNTPMHHTGVPLSVRLTFGILKYWRSVSTGCDVLEFHRIEPAIPFLFDRRHKNVFVHQNMDALYNPNADIGWKRLPWAFFALEALILPRLQSIFGVREDAIVSYKARYPKISDRFRFIPTWMDPELFHPVGTNERVAVRAEIFAEFGLPPEVEMIVSVGRLDHQKNPLLAVEVLQRLVEVRPGSVLVWIGDGVLRPDIEQAILAKQLQKKVILAGLLKPHRIAQILQASDAYLMTSAYEGMPISVLEALGTGLPVVSTSVGEVPRVIQNGLSGLVVEGHEPVALVAGLVEVLSRGQASYESDCLAAVSPYVPDRVLGPLFSVYRSATPSSESK